MGGSEQPTADAAIEASEAKGYRKRVIVSLSGGIDSTYILYRLLKDTDHEIIVMHIRMFDKKGRYKKEWEAVESLCLKLRRIRPFEVITLGQDFSNLDMKTFDMCVVGFCFGVLIRDLYTKGIPVDEIYIGTHEREGHWKKRWDAIRAMIDSHIEGANFPYDSVPLMLPSPLPTKKQEMEALTEAGLINDVWYCREPQGNKTCGECHTCKEVAEAVD